jgi:RNA polymerase sigma factor (sigma-70 family)
LAAWLATILRNLFLTRYQRAKRVVEVEFEPDIAEVSMEAPQFHSVELRDTEMAIRNLKPEQRQVIHKCGVEGVSYEDAASEMGVSVGTIRSRLSRARSQLRQPRKPNISPLITPRWTSMRLMSARPSGLRRTTVTTVAP